MALIFLVLGLISGLVATITSFESGMISDLLICEDKYEMNMTTIKHLEEKKERIDSITKSTSIFFVIFFVLFILIEII